MGSPGSCAQPPWLPAWPPAQTESHEAEPLPALCVSGPAPAQKRTQIKSAYSTTTVYTTATTVSTTASDVTAATAAAISLHSSGMWLKSCLNLLHMCIFLLLVCSFLPASLTRFIILLPRVSAGFEKSWGFLNKKSLRRSYRVYEIFFLVCRVYVSIKPGRKIYYCSTTLRLRQFCMWTLNYLGSLLKLFIHPSSQQSIFYSMWLINYIIGNFSF